MLIYLSLLIGFTIGVCEPLRQRSHTTLFEAFKLVFKMNHKIEDDGKYMKFSVSSDLINVVTFFNNSGLYCIVYLD